jgi:hypothetical protein
MGRSAHPTRKEYDVYALRRTVLAVTLTALTALAAASPAVAGDRHSGRGGPEIVPAHRVLGQSGGTLLGEFYARLLPIPNTENPFGAGPGQCVRVGRHGRVVMPAGTPNQCTVTTADRIVVPAATLDCSSNEPPPFHGGTAREQRRCAITQGTEAYATMPLTVDGAPPVDIRKPRFAVLSPQLASSFASDPIFGATPGPTTFVAFGWIAEIRNLRPGHHVIVGTPTGSFGTFTFTEEFDVVRAGHK